MFNFFKKNKFGLSNLEMKYAKKLNSDIQRLDSRALLDVNVNSLSRDIYIMSTRRANVTSFDKIIYSNEVFNDPQLLMNHPELLNHVEINNHLPNLVKECFSVIVKAVIQKMPENKTLNFTQESLSMLIDNTTTRLKSS